MFRIAFLSVALILVMMASALAGPNANEFEFVGKANDCGAGYPAGAKIVQSNWLTGIGLPDNGGNNTPVGLNPADLQNPNDNRYGLLLMKNGTTPNCSSAGVTFSGIGTWVVDTPLGNRFLGFDYLDGSTCDGGAPRFNVSWKVGTGPTQFSFVGNCSLGTTTTSTQDPSWKRVVWDVTGGGAFPPIPAGANITAVTVIFDEGTDTGPGFAIIDNILVNGKYQTAESKTCPAGSPCTGISEP